jgi:hypothetical protein
MNEWEAKYKALLMGIADEQLVTNAEAIVQRSIEISRNTPQRFADVCAAMLDTIGKLNNLNQRLSSAGLPEIVVDDSLPKNTVVPAKYPRQVLDDLYAAGEISAAQRSRLMDEPENNSHDVETPG